MNVRQVITSAYREAGMLGDSSPLDGERVNVGLEKLNELLAQLNLDSSFSANSIVAEIPVPAPKREYTLGEAANSPDIVLSARPADVVSLYVRAGVAASPIRLRKVSISDVLEYSLPLGAQAIPSCFAFQSTFPNAIVRFNCDVQLGAVLSFVFYSQFKEVAFNDDLPLSGEYQTCVIYGLASRLAARYGRPQDVIGNLDALYREAKSNIAARNANRRPLRHAGYDGNEYNIYNLGGNAPARFF